MPELVLLIAKKDGETFCARKSDLDMANVPESLLNESFPDGWNWLTLKAKDPTTRDKLAIDKDCDVYPDGNKQPFRDYDLMGQKRFMRLVTSVNDAPPKEDFYLDLNPDAAGAIDSWLTLLMFGGLSRDPSFSKALSTLLADSGQAKPSA